MAIYKIFCKLNIFYKPCKIQFHLKIPFRFPCNQFSEKKTTTSYKLNRELILFIVISVIFGDFKTFFLLYQVNLCGGGTSSRAAEDVGSIIVQAARDRRAGTANSCPGCGKQSPYVVEYKTVVRINLP